MFDDLATYFFENVFTPFEEYRDIKTSGVIGRSRDLKAAVVAATSLYHLREHLPATSQLSRAAICLLCPDYGIAGDIVNAAKHKSLNRGDPTIIDATQIGEVTIITEYQDDDGSFHWSEKAVVVKLNDGTERDVHEVLTNVINFWWQHLHSIGVIPTSRTFFYPSAPQPRTRSECADCKSDIEMVRGLRFQQKIRLKKYNYTTGQIEPVDLTGKSLTFKMFPFEPCTIDLSLRNESTGESFSEAVTFDEDESSRIDGFSTEEEKKNYIESHPLVKEAVRRLSKLAGIETT